MAVTVRLPGALRDATGGKTKLEASAGTLAEIISDIDRRHPGFRSRVLDDSGAIREARRLATTRDHVYVDQYSNPANPLAHELTTGPEIWSQTEERVTHFVSGVGTSGTIVGVSAALRPRGVRIIAVQPDDALHGIEGWKHMPTALRPRIWDERVADEHRVMATDEAIAMTIHSPARSLTLPPGLADSILAHSSPARPTPMRRNGTSGVSPMRSRIVPRTRARTRSAVKVM